MHVCLSSWGWFWVHMSKPWVKSTLGLESGPWTKLLEHWDGCVACGPVDHSSWWSACIYDAFLTLFCMLKFQLQMIAAADDFLDETSSQSSSHSGTYSNLNFICGNEHGTNTIPTGGDKHPISKCHKSTRFCPEENRNTGHSMAKKYYERCKAFLASGSKDKRIVDSRRLMRNKSLVDVRSHLLHRSLVEEVNRRRLFKTVGAVENIGFQAPCEVSKKL